MRRIIVFAAFYHPYKGGYVESIHELAVRLLKRGYKIFIVACGEKNYQKNIEGIEICGLCCWNPIFLNNSFPIPHPTAVLKLLKFIYNNKFDYAVINTRFFPITWIGFLFGKLGGIPVIHIERGGQHALTKNYLINLAALVVDHTIAFVVVRFSNVAVGVSDAACVFLKHLGAVKPIKIYNGIDVDSKLNVSYGDKLPLKVTFVGRIIYAKGLNELVNSAPSLNNVIIQIIGGGPYKKEIEAAVGRLNLREKVIFLGEMNHQDVMKTLLNSDIFINTSYSEGLPRCVLEAGSVGLPVIATDVGGTREIISDNECGFLISPRDVNAIVESVNKLVSDTGLRERLGRRIKNHINGAFNWESIITRYEKECFGSHNFL